MNPKQIVFSTLAIFSIFVAYAWSSHVYTQASNGLKKEELVAAAGNKQILAAKQIQEEYRRKREDAAREREFNRAVYGSSDAPPEVVQQQIEQHLRKIAEQPK